MTNSYAKACTELLEIIKYLPKEEYEKIPKEKITVWEQNKDIDYEFKIDPNQPIEEQNISIKTNAMIIALFKECFASEKQKEKLQRILKQNDLEIQKEKQQKYSYENIFKTENKKEAVNEVKEENLAVMKVEKESIIKRIIMKIKNIFKR